MDKKHETKIITDLPWARLIQIQDGKALESHLCPCLPIFSGKPFGRGMPFRWSTPASH